MLSVSRRLFLAGTAIGLAGLPRIAVAEAPKRGGVLRMSVDQAASVIHPMQARVNPAIVGWTVAHAGDQSVNPPSNTTVGEPDPEQWKLSRAPSPAGASRPGRV